MMKSEIKKPGTQSLWRTSFCLVLFVFTSLAYAAGDPLPLWEVRAPRATVYLFGSIHACKASCYPLPESVLKRFDASKNFVLELDPSRTDAQAKLAEAASLPANESLESKLNAEDLRNLRSALNELGLPEAAMMRLRPWMVNTLITLTAAQKQGLNTEQGIDVWLFNRAQSQNKNIVELETVERQIAALTSGKERDQIASLRQTVDTFKRQRIGPYFEEMISAWQKGDIAKMEALVKEDEGTDKSLLIEILDRRNEEMAAKLAQWLERGNSSFVVVGLAHLVGKNNLGDLLVRKGFTVRQLRSGD